MLRYRTILFDLDHTLLDSDASEIAAFDLTMASVGAAHTDATFAAYKRINIALWAAVERGETSPDEVAVERFRQFNDELNIQADAEAMAATFRTGLGAYGDLYPGALDILKTLRPNATIGMVTNGIVSVQQARIDRLDLAVFFDVVVISSGVGVAKPDPAIFDHVWTALPDTDPASTVIIGDSLSSDIAGGRNAGIDTVWFNRHGANTESGHHAQHGITHEITTLPELLPLLLPNLPT